MTTILFWSSTTFPQNLNQRPVYAKNHPYPQVGIMNILYIIPFIH